MNDRELLLAWVEQRSESAFAELVHRHVGLVYASALRQVREPELARDVTQAVFLALARKAGSLGSQVVLSGWLFRTTTFVAARALRTEFRRQRREYETAAMNSLSPSSEAIPESWIEVESYLDDALATLPGADRDVILLRFFERQPLRQVGERLGISEEAAKKRLHRAVGKLRRFFNRRGVLLTASGLLTVLGHLPVQAVPADLAVAIQRTVLTTASPPLTALVSGGLRDAFWASTRAWTPWIATALLLFLTGTWGWTALRSSRLDRRFQEQVSAVTASETVAAPSTEPGTLRPDEAQIVLDVRSAMSRQGLQARVVVNVVRQGKIQREWEMNTDDAGSATIPVGDSSVDAVQVWVSAPSHVPLMAAWQGHELVQPRVLGTFWLEPGEVFQGMTADESGQPVAGAEIHLRNPTPDSGQRQNIAFHRRLNSLRTDASGRFRSDQLPSLFDRSVIFSADHPDYAQSTFTLKYPDHLATNRVVVLHRGLWLRGRVVSGADGLPVADMPLFAERSASGESRRSRVDHAGRFVVGPFAGGSMPLTLVLEPEGFAPVRFKIELTAGQPETVLHLPSDLPTQDGADAAADHGQKVRLVGRVTDEATGLPIPRFRVRLRENWETQARLLGEATDGQFDWSITMAFQPEFSVEIEADDYETVVTERRPVAAGPEEFTIPLKPGQRIIGWVVDGAGLPAVGAVVGLNGPDREFGLQTDGTLLAEREGPKTLTDREGKFSFPPQPRAESVLVAAPAGYARAFVAELREHRIRLQPWGAIEGTYAVGESPAPGSGILLRDWIPADPAKPLGILLNTHTWPDAEGNFRFLRVPAGTVELIYPQAGGSSRTVEVHVPAGQTVKVHLAGNARPLVGVLRAAPAIPDHDWRQDFMLLERVFPDEAPRGRRAQLIRERLQQTASQALQPVIEPDGSFRFADVPGGEYRLEVTLRRPPRTDSEYGRVEIPGHLILSFTVPDANDGDATVTPFDLGIVEVPLDGATSPP